MKRFVMALFGLTLAVSALVRPAQALTEPELMVERARVTALTLLTDPQYKDLKSLVGRARSWVAAAALASWWRAAMMGRGAVLPSTPWRRPVLACNSAGRRRK